MKYKVKSFTANDEEINKFLNSVDISIQHTVIGTNGKIFIFYCDDSIPMPLFEGNLKNLKETAILNTPRFDDVSKEPRTQHKPVFDEFIYGYEIHDGIKMRLNKSGQLDKRSTEYKMWQQQLGNTVDESESKDDDQPLPFNGETK